MGKLNIAHHKSYHPYRRDNIERVRRDEEEARRREAAEEGRMMLADSEARMDLLRLRAGLGAGKGKSAKRDDMAELDAALAGGAGPSAGAAGAGERSVREPEAAVSTLTAANGHINFFEDLERQVIPVYRSSSRAGRGGSGKEKGGREDERGVALAPSAKDLRPWYVAAGEGKEAEQETDEQKRRRDAQRKSAHDPLTAINSQLAARSSGGSGSGPSASFPAPGHRQRHPDRPGAGTSSSSKPAQADPGSARLARESAERQRARELVERKRREREAAMRGSETPSTVRGGERGRGGYGDVFNRREVDEVRRDRERRFGRRRHQRRHSRARHATASARTGGR
ncbi:hypothetical protein PYCCODRAFT_1446439 [Trametes coccinea BRFM310]|uniref:CBF1-interacting co-repressor CIR N-terminal domain-containing protein n=1 Tax=Trametes coccinea (strain BRFM310) TaxID=1353009 RepID=A0A1Y2IHT9_TRAC3|nr:hypothetical protein PYCCODRAFT_1446439 [Trametes coccinea BRFM310]